MTLHLCLYVWAKLGQIVCARVHVCVRACWWFKFLAFSSQQTDLIPEFSLCISLLNYNFHNLSAFIAKRCFFFFLNISSSFLSLFRALIFQAHSHTHTLALSLHKYCSSYAIFRDMCQRRDWLGIGLSRSLDCRIFRIYLDLMWLWLDCRLPKRCAKCIYVSGLFNKILSARR